jgi:hypothetical protein
VIFLDFETAKVPCDFVRPDTGEKMSRRWRVIAAGIGFEDGSVVVLDDDDEMDLLEQISAFFKPGETVVYCATREFDEMIAKGRFTNARRAHLPEACFPSVPGAEDVDWVNIRKFQGLSERKPSADDLPSKDVPDAWKRGERDRVIRHLVADVEWLIENRP